MQDHILKFSVIIPLYNKELSVRSTIESVLNQTWPHFELIIVNDGSTDCSLEVLHTFTDPRIKIINQANQGVSSARNRGIQESQNEFIAFLDADDLWRPFALEELMYLILNYPKDALFSANYTISGKNIKGTNKRYYVHDYFYSAAIVFAKWSIPLLVTGIVALRKTCLLEIGGFKEGITHGEDIEFWDRLASRFLIAKSERIVMVYRQNTENRASLINEDQKKFPDSTITGKRVGKCNSKQLYYGCLDLVNIFHNLRNFKIVKAIKLFYSNFFWVLHAVWLFMKYRSFRCKNEFKQS